MTLAFLTGSPADWGIIFVLALIVFGPKKMPEIGRQLGQAMREFRKMADEFSGAATSVRDEVESAYKPVLHPPPVSEATSSDTVERAMTHHPLDQEEDLMAPVVPPIAPMKSATESSAEIPDKAIAPIQSHEADSKGH